MFSNKNVLVTGGTGLIGRPLVRMLLESGAHVRVAALDIPTDVIVGPEYFNGDLTSSLFCDEITKDIDFVFHLASPKGSKAYAKSKSSFFYVANILINTNIMEASKKNGVSRFLYASTMHVYSKDNKSSDDVLIFKEEDASTDNCWGGRPYIPNHASGLWAKRMGELQLQTYLDEFGWKNVAIVRPTTVYGPYDNFDKESCFFIPSIIQECMAATDGVNIVNKGYGRDFLYCDDAAYAMMLAMEHCCFGAPVNIGCGQVHMVDDVVKCVLDILNKECSIRHQNEYNEKTMLDITKIKKVGFEPKFSLYDGLKNTIDWFQESASA